jgi:hypothetical protein
MMSFAFTYVALFFLKKNLFIVLSSTKNHAFLPKMLLNRSSYPMMSFSHYVACSLKKVFLSC